MFHVDNMRKFVHDNSEKIGTLRAAAIPKRAEALTRDGVLGGATIPQIMADGRLAAQFTRTITTNVVHMEIGIEAIRRMRYAKSELKKLLGG